MNEKNNIAPTIEMELRKNKAKEFYDAIIDPDEHPWLVTDEASLYDLTLEEDETLIERIYQFYGVRIEKRLLSIPFWKLLDYLQERKVSNSRKKEF